LRLKKLHHEGTKNAKLYIFLRVLRAFVVKSSLI
jgi:hypothetical protein